MTEMVSPGITKELAEVAEEGVDEHVVDSEAVRRVKSGGRPMGHVLVELRQDVVERVGRRRGRANINT